MKLQFKHQKFQADAAKAVCDVFAGQPFEAPTHQIDTGLDPVGFGERLGVTGFGNASIILNDLKVLEHIQKIQLDSLIKRSDKLEGKYNLTIEMETGVGKTYTYIKTMYELNQKYGWSKFIIVVPSVAIREGVYKSFQDTEEHFSGEYGKKIRYFIYNSAHLNEIDRFASDSSINAMIINSQAFNARGKDANRISMRLDEFRSRRPIDILAKTRPIVIIDEPQSVEGPATKAKLTEFNPLFTLRYSATHRQDSIYNLIYRLDALDAYNKRLVKRIAVKGVTATGNPATEGYVYLQSINISKGNPTATMEFDIRRGTGVHKTTRNFNEGINLFDHSGGLEEYRDGFTIKTIDGRDSSVEFLNGKRLVAGEVIGAVNEAQLRRIQIRETILSHIERERQLFHKDIKVLSLFFIDEVAKYRQYGDSGIELNGEYAEVFEEEYQSIVESLQLEFSDLPDYLAYLNRFSKTEIHQGYFSIDKRSNKLVNSKLRRGREGVSDDVDAYDLIMKNKQKLLSFEEPVRFIFSHSALREGWDNPNVFQICTLKQSGSEVRKRQEVGRGLRLSVNRHGERMDEGMLGRGDVHNLNILTVIASESYETFAAALQNEIAEAVGDRPRKVEPALFKEAFGEDIAWSVCESLIKNEYIVRGEITEKYYADKAADKIELPEEVKGRETEVLAILDRIYNPAAISPEDGRANNVAPVLDKAKLNGKAFLELWKHINHKSYYTVQFDENELINKSIEALNSSLRVSEVEFKISHGIQRETISSKDELLQGEAFDGTKVIRQHGASSTGVSGSNIRYDLIGKIVADTGLTRKAVASILAGIKSAIFNQFSKNPEEFIIRASKIITDQKATVVIEQLVYNKREETFSTEIFTEPALRKGKLGVNAMLTERNIYDYLVYDSQIERDFATNLEQHPGEVEVYAKLPGGFYIDTPVGSFNPDWAIVFRNSDVRHIYFVAETKGSMDTLQLKGVEDAKIKCARKHFRAISGNMVKFDFVDSFERLLEIVRGES